MKPLLFIFGILAAIVFIEKPADAQSGGWCAYLNGGGHAALAETARLVRIMSRRVTPGIDGAILIDRATASAPTPATSRYSRDPARFMRCFAGLWETSR